MASSARDAHARREALLVGARMEALVERVLAADGWLILARNWRGGGGELDVVARRGEAGQAEVCFVEVKARDQEDPLADEAISASKRTRLRRAARLWLEQASWDGPASFLVAMVDPADETVLWIADAFDG